MENTQPGCSRVFFDKWFAAINNEKQLPRVHDKKLSIITLTALMEMEPGMVPEPLREGWPGIVAGALKLFKALPKAVAGRELFFQNPTTLIVESHRPESVGGGNAGGR